MLKINSTIIYGSQVCKVKEVSKLTIGKVARDYYVLSPVYDDKNVIYVPTDNPKLVEKIKEILSAEEIKELIRTMPDKEGCFIEDDKERAAEFKRILESGKREEIIGIIKTLYERRNALKEKGKKLHSSDEIIFERAEKIIYDEFALVLNIKRDEVVPFILKQIDAPNAK